MDTSNSVMQGWWLGRIEEGGADREINRTIKAVQKISKDEALEIHDAVSKVSQAARLNNILWCMDYNLSTLQLCASQATTNDATKAVTFDAPNEREYALSAALLNFSNSVYTYKKHIESILNKFDRQKAWKDFWEQILSKEKEILLTQAVRGISVHARSPALHRPSGLKDAFYLYANEIRQSAERRLKPLLDEAYKEDELISVCQLASGMRTALTSVVDYGMAMALQNAEAAAILLIKESKRGASKNCKNTTLFHFPTGWNRNESMSMNVTLLQIGAAQSIVEGAASTGDSNV